MRKWRWEWERGEVGLVMMEEKKSKSKAKGGGDGEREGWKIGKPENMVEVASCASFACLSCFFVRLLFLWTLDHPALSWWDIYWTFENLMCNCLYTLCLSPPCFLLITPIPIHSSWMLKIICLCFTKSFTGMNERLPWIYYLILQKRTPRILSRLITSCHLNSEERKEKNPDVKFRLYPSPQLIRSRVMLLRILSFSFAVFVYSVPLTKHSNQLKVQSIESLAPPPLPLFLGHCCLAEIERLGKKQD